MFPGAQEATLIGDIKIKRIIAVIAESTWKGVVYVTLCRGNPLNPHLTADAWLLTRQIMCCAFSEELRSMYTTYLLSSRTIAT